MWQTQNNQLISSLKFGKTIAKFLILSLRFLIFTVLILASLTGNTFEPLNTDDAGTILKNSNQIEQYFFRTTSHGGGAATNMDVITPGEEYFGVGDAKAFPFTYTRGLTDNLEAAVGTTYFSAPRGNYSPISNKVFSMKWRFLEGDDKGWALAMKPSITLPGSPQQQIYGLNYAMPNYELTLIGSRYWDLIELHTNISYTKALYNTNYLVGGGPSSNRTNIFFISVAPVWKVNQTAKLAIDIGMTTNPPSSEQPITSYGLVAAIISITDDIDVGLSYMRSAVNPGVIFNNSGIGASRSEIGFTWRF